MLLISLCLSMVPLGPVKDTSRQEVAVSGKVAVFLAILSSWRCSLGMGGGALISLVMGQNSLFLLRSDPFLDICG